VLVAVDTSGRSGLPRLFPFSALGVMPRRINGERSTFNGLELPADIGWRRARMASA
jgi:hypothetical protein